MLTLKDAKNSRIPSYLGTCPDSDDFVSYINEAMNRLITRGNWNGSYQRIRLCTTNNCLTFPREIVTVQSLAVCSQNVPVKNMWWEFVPNAGYSLNGCSDACPGPGFIDRGFYPIFNDMSSGGGYLRAFASMASDYGKKIHIFGYDSNNQWIRSTEGGVQIDGFKMTLASPYVQSSFIVTNITGVQKEETDADVNLYEVDPADGSLLQLGTYEPSETVASYRRYQFNGSQCDTCTTTFTGIAKLNFIPVSVDSDYLYISNLPALKEMCKAIKFGEMESADSERKSLYHERRAITELNHEKQNLNGDDTIPIKIRPFGSATNRYRMIGRLQ